MKNMKVMPRLTSRIRNFIDRNEYTVIRILRGLITLFGLWVIRAYFGYAQSLDSAPLVIVVAVLCAFIPFSASSLILSIYLLIHLYALSGRVAGVTLILFIASYILCGFYRSRQASNIVYYPLCYQLQFPFAIPMISGLTGSINEVTSVLCGSVIAFYLTVIRRNASLFLEKKTQTSVVDLIIRNMFYNPLFYFFVFAMIAMFVVVYVIRERTIHHGWDIAVTAGILSEFILMLIGYFMTGNTGRVPQLILWNVVVWLAGIIIGTLVRGMDYTHIEKVQFEDDEYYYYVTAVPKTRIAEEDKEIRHITEPEGRRKRSQRRKRSRNASSDRRKSDRTASDHQKPERTSSVSGEEDTAADCDQADASLTDGAGTKVSHASNDLSADQANGKEDIQ